MNHFLSLSILSTRKKIRKKCFKVNGVLIIRFSETLCVPNYPTLPIIVCNFVSPTLPIIVCNFVSPTLTFLSGIIDPNFQSNLDCGS